MKTVTCLGVFTTGGALPFKVDVSRHDGVGGSLRITGPVGTSAVTAIRDAVTAARRHTSEFVTPLEVVIHSALPVDGDSLGLGIAVAAVAELLDMPLPDGVAYTGCVDPVGLVKEVGGVPEKIAAAYEAGFHTVLLPTKVAPSKVKHVGSLSYAVHTLEERNGAV